MSAKAESLTGDLERRPEQKRSAFLSVCESLIADTEGGHIGIERAAYQICGASASLNRPLDHPIDEIVRIACDLELPPAQQSLHASDWWELVRLVQVETKKPGIADDAGPTA